MLFLSSIVALVPLVLSVVAAPDLLADIDNIRKALQASDAILQSFIITTDSAVSGVQTCIGAVASNFTVLATDLSGLTDTMSEDQAIPFVDALGNLVSPFTAFSTSLDAAYPQVAATGQLALQGVVNGINRFTGAVRSTFPVAESKLLLVFSLQVKVVEENFNLQLSAVEAAYHQSVIPT